MSFFWTELNTSDPDRARAFYSATMGWEFRQADAESGYWLVTKGEAVIGGLYAMDPQEFVGVPSHWFSYVEVEDVDAACRIAIEAGGSVLRAPMSIPTVGRIAILRDPTGSPIGCITPDRERLTLAA